jgi:ribonuclease PH
MRENRTASELRKINITRHYTKYAEGSVLIEYGCTHVLCTASITPKLPSHAKDNAHGWITAEYSMLPRATHTRMDREASKGKQSGRTQEIQRLIGRSLRASIALVDIHPYCIQIDCDVIQADGGTRTASITGAWIALHDAIQHMYNQKLITQMPHIQQVAAVSVGMLQNQILLDLDYAEDSTCDTDLNLVMSQQGIIEIQGTAEGKALDYAQLQNMITMGMQGIHVLFEHQAKCLAV